MVDTKALENVSSVKRRIRHVLPTPLSPSKRIFCAFARLG